MKTKHKTPAALLLALTLAISLAGCGEQTASIYKPKRLALNTISQVELTDRERLLTGVNGGYTFMFDYKVDESYGAVNIWIERYDFGVLAEPQDPSMETTLSVGYDGPGPMSGGIVIAACPLIDEAGVSADDKGAVRMIVSNGQVSSSYETAAIEIPKHSGGYVGSAITAKTPIDGVIELAQMSYSSNGASFSPNPETNAELRKQHDVVYLIKCEFVKKA